MEAKDGDDYLDMVELVQDILARGGLSNIAIMVMDLYVEVIFAICHAQDKAVTRDWIEEHVGLSEAQDIFFKQMAKDEVQGRAMDFLAL